MPVIGSGPPMSDPRDEMVVSDSSSPPRMSSAPIERSIPPTSAPLESGARSAPLVAGDAGDAGDARQDEPMPDASHRSIITNISDDEGADQSEDQSEEGSVSGEDSGSESSGEEGEDADPEQEQDGADSASIHGEGQPAEDEEDDDDDEDDDEDDEDDGDSVGEHVEEDEVKGDIEGEREDSPNCADASGDVNMVDTPDEGASNEKRGKLKTRIPSPASVDEDDIVMPTSAPTRPTVRLQLAFDMDPQLDTSDAYTMDFPKLLIAHLKPKGDKWAMWFEGQSTSKEPVEMPPAPTAPNEMEDLGDLAGLLARHPVEKKKRKKRMDDPHDVGAYDTKDPFVDDSELVVDEPVYFARSARGFFVAAGAANLAKPSKRKKRVSEAAKPNAEGRVSQHLSSIMATAVRIEGRDPGSTSLAQLFWHERALQDGPIRVNLPNVPADADAQAALAKEAVEMSRALAEKTLALPQEGESEAQARLALSGAERGLASPACLFQLAHRIDDRVEVPDAPVEPPGGKKRAYDPKPLPGLLVVGLAALYALVKQESFAVKSKFPPGLKQPLVHVARLALDLGVYNNNFFDWLPSIFPYNRFTLRKLTIREFFVENLALLEGLQEESLTRMRELAEKRLGRMKEEWERSPIVQDGESGETAVQPAKKWKFTEDEKEEIWLSVVLGDAMTELQNDKATLEKTEGISDIMSRKTVYKKIAERWPKEGEVTSTLVATQFNSVKKKHERLVRLAEE